MQIQVRCSCGKDGCLEWAIVELQGAVEAHESRSSKAGLEFPVGHIARFLKASKYAEHVGAGAPVYLAAIFEYLAAEVLVF
ncbi:probable histone h2a.3 [Phtheirospermum japonicum]|uniref:Probable histone h2a.3 n=1 Tax=Phtheirospermum japonicum TaxID=374723 RepID=A0A830B3L8_9LAMI|nr:probable histone h2a.3 [Phtheirospermum japonicum]